jgi:hypothetical protein
VRKEPAWPGFAAEPAGIVTMREGSCWLQPPKIKHAVLDYSDDCELLEIILPADFATVELEKLPNSLQQGILQGILPIPAVFGIFGLKFASDSSAFQRNSLRKGAGNFCRRSRGFFGRAGNCREFGNSRKLVIRGRNDSELIMERRMVAAGRCGPLIDA